MRGRKEDPVKDNITTGRVCTGLSPEVVQGSGCHLALGLGKDTEYPEPMGPGGGCQPSTDFQFPQVPADAKPLRGGGWFVELV